MVSEILLRGSEHAIPGRQICAQLGISPRQLRTIVERERRNGYPICANCSGRHTGYFLAADRDEIEHYCKVLFRRAGEIHKTRKACMEAAQTLPPWRIDSDD